MKGKTILITDSFDSSRDYGIHIRPQIRRVLEQLECGQQYILSELVQRFDGVVTKKKNLSTTRDVFKHVLNIGKRIGMIKEIRTEPISFDEFCRLDTVHYMRRQLKETRFQNPGAKTKHSGGGTRRSYSFHLWHFNNWLYGKTITTRIATMVGNDLQRIHPKTVKLKTVQDLLRLYQESASNGPEFERMIKEYLMDEIHSKKSLGYMSNITSAIKAYFEKNESPITIRFNPDVDHDTTRSNQHLSLDDLMELLVSGRPSVVERAVVMCKFHAGLDNSTFADRFNFEAWPQLVKWFGTRNHSEWDMKKCPAMIRITRIKVGFEHVCFLDQDAISALKKALDWRQKKTGSMMESGQPIFLNTYGRPVTDRWVSELLPKLAEKAQVQKKHPGLLRMHNEKVSHELRDLLKSTLRASGASPYAANHAIGHMPQDSYEKEQILYPEKIRAEYAKASNMLNIFTRFSSVVSGSDNVSELRVKLEDAILTQKKIQKEKDNQKEWMGHMEDVMTAMQNEINALKKKNRSDEKMRNIANKIIYNNEQNESGYTAKQNTPSREKLLEQYDRLVEIDSFNE